jgi:hypothetical protein
MSPSGTATKKRPNISEDTLREVKRLLTGDRQEFKPATLGESLKYNFLGLTPEKEEQSGSFGKALMDETNSQFRQLFGIKTTKKERQAEEEAALKKIEEEKKAKELQEQKAEKNSDNIEAILGEVRTIRKVTEGSVKYSPKSGRYQDAATGRFVASSAVSGIDAPSDVSNEQILEKLSEIDENTEVAGEAEEGGFLDMLKAIPIGTLTSAFLPIVTAIAAAWTVNKLSELLDEIEAARDAKAIAKKSANLGAAMESQVVNNLKNSGVSGADAVLSRAQEMARENPDVSMSTNIRKAAEELGVSLPSSVYNFNRQAATAGITDLRAQADVTATPRISTPARGTLPIGSSRPLPSFLTPVTPSAQPVVINNMSQIAPTTQMAAPTGRMPTAKELRDVLGSHMRFQQERIISPLK